MVTRFAAILSLLLAASAYAKCPIQQLEVAGSVISEGSSVPVIGARIFVRLDPQLRTRTEGEADYSDYAQTDDEGRFKAISYFDTQLDYSDDAGHICMSVPREAELIVLARGFLSHRQTLPLEGVSPQVESNLVQLEEPIVMTASPQWNDK
jgi:hypothetical protein